MANTWLYNPGSCGACCGSPSLTVCVQASGKCGYVDNDAYWVSGNINGVVVTGSCIHNFTDKAKGCCITLPFSGNYEIRVSPFLGNHGVPFYPIVTGVYVESSKINGLNATAINRFTFGVQYSGCSSSTIDCSCACLCIPTANTLTFTVHSGGCTPSNEFFGYIPYTNCDFIYRSIGGGSGWFSSTSFTFSKVPNSKVYYEFYCATDPVLGPQLIVEAIDVNGFSSARGYFAYNMNNTVGNQCYPLALTNGNFKVYDPSTGSDFCYADLSQ